MIPKYTIYNTEQNVVAYISTMEGDGLDNYSSPIQILDISFDSVFPHLVLANDLSERFIAGFNFNITGGSAYDGSYTVSSNAYTETYPDLRKITFVPLAAPLTINGFEVVDVITGSDGKFAVIGPSNGSLIFYPEAIFELSGNGSISANQQYSTLESKTSTSYAISDISTDFLTITISGIYDDIFILGHEVKLSNLLHNTGDGIYTVVTSTNNGVETTIELDHAATDAVVQVGSTITPVIPVTIITVDGVVPFDTDVSGIITPVVATSSFNFSPVDPIAITQISPNVYNVVWSIIGDLTPNIFPGSIIRVHNVVYNGELYTQDLHVDSIALVGSNTNITTTLTTQLPITPVITTQSNSNVMFPPPPIPFGSIQYVNDVISSPLHLIGPGSPSYNRDETWGVALQHNNIVMLENFNNDLPPPAPLKGQFWFDNSVPTIKTLYDDTTYRIMSIVTGLNGSFTISGDQTSNPKLQPGKLLYVYNNLGMGELGNLSTVSYTVQSITLVGSDTEIVVTDTIPTEADILTSITVARFDILNKDLLLHNFYVTGNQTTSFTVGTVFHVPGDQLSPYVVSGTGSTYNAGDNTTEINVISEISDTNNTLIAFYEQYYGHLYSADNWLEITSSGAVNYAIQTTPSKAAIVGPNELFIYQVQDYTITNYDDFATYDLTAISGSVSRVGDTITYTAPSSSGAGGFTINNYDVNITIMVLVPDTPSIDSPVTGSIDLGPSVDFIGSTFNVTGDTDTHEGSDWQLATDSGFNNIVQQVVNSATDKETWTVDNLDPDTEFFARVRYKGTVYDYSEWSDSISFTTKSEYLANVEEVKLTASDKANTDLFGQSVAMDGTGTRVVVGARGEDAGGLSDAGSSYVYLRTGSSWTEEAKIMASDKAAGDSFGQAVAIDSTGTRIAIGAYAEDPGGTSNAGSVYIFTRSGTIWTEEAKLIASDKGSDDYFGYSVAMNSDGTRIIVGAKDHDTGGLSRSGAAYVFTRSGSVWSQEAILSASDKAVLDYFGTAVDIDSTGTRVVIGAPYEDPSAVSEAGAAYVFTRSGSSWSQEAKLTASDKETLDYFGDSVAIDRDGLNIIIGAYSESPDGVSEAGSAYVFTRSGSSWSEEVKLSASDKDTDCGFGNSVAINNTGTILLIGAYTTDASGFTNSGAAYIFTKSGSVWTEAVKLIASDVEVGDWFGWDVDMDSAGTRAVIGALQEDAGGFPNAGSAYIFS